jgi:glycosyltransferase involved in cell wall biosynthesis
MTEITVVIPVFDEEGSLEELHRRLTQALAAVGRTYEVIYVDDGSRDGSPGILKAIFERDPRTKVLTFRRRYGKSAALAVGFEEARGQVIVTMDADLQDDPAEIPNLLAKLDQGYDLVSGWKKDRKDPLEKTVPSKIFNSVTARVTGLKLHDMNCGLKAYRREVTDELKIYGELHRFLPVFAHKDNFRVGEIPVTHYPRLHGRTKYGVRRFVHGFLDLLTVIMLTGYTRSPLHFFGSLGIFFTLVGLCINCFLIYLKIIHGNIQGRTPLLMLGVLLMIMGLQLVSTGLLAELITRAGHKGRKEYGLRARLSHDQEEEARHNQAH